MPGSIRRPHHPKTGADISGSAPGYGDGHGHSEPVKRLPPWIREVDDWFSTHLLPHERVFIQTAYRMTGDEDTARDLVHETYVDLLKGERWRGIKHPRAYVMTSVRRAALRIIRRRRIVPFKSFADMDAVAGKDLTPDAHQILFAKEQRRMVLEIIETLPPRCREVVKLRRLAERSPQQIARDLGITVSVVDKHLARGMATIAKKLSDFDGHEEGKAP